MKIEKLEKKIKKMQDKKRFTHTLGVKYTAACLAMKYDIDINKAKVAGLLHDCAKQLPEKKMISICQKEGISISEVEMTNPFLLHGKAGAIISRHKFSIEDQDILNAIANHTTGRPCMSMLEKIIFIADYIEPGRVTVPNLKEIRKTAFEDIDKCLVMILENTLNYLKGKKCSIDPTTQETFDYYRKVIENDN